MRRFLLISLVCLFGCEKQEEDSFLKYLTEVHHINAEKQWAYNFYLINLNSCTDCVNISLDFLSKNSSLDIDVILVGRHKKFLKSFQGLGYDLLYDDLDMAFKYGHYTQKPLLVTIRNGEICNKVNIKDAQVEHLKHYLICD
jgi:hypothetical protein